MPTTRLKSKRGVRWFGITCNTSPVPSTTPHRDKRALKIPMPSSTSNRRTLFFAALRNIGDTRVVQYGFQRIPRGVNRALHVVLLVPSIGPIGVSHRSAPEGAVWIGNLQSIAISKKFYLVFVHTFPVVNCLGFRVHRVSGRLPTPRFFWAAATGRVKVYTSARASKRAVSFFFIAISPCNTSLSIVLVYYFSRELQEILEKYPRPNGRGRFFLQQPCPR